MWHLPHRRPQRFSRFPNSPRRRAIPCHQHVPRILHGPIAEVELVGATAVATLSVTELSRAEGLEQLAELIDDLAVSGVRHFVLDIQNVQFMDSACLAWMVEALNWLAKRGGRIALANAVHGVRNVFKLSRLDRMFPVCSDVMAAMAAVDDAADWDE